MWKCSNCDEEFNQFNKLCDKCGNILEFVTSFEYENLKDLYLIDVNQNNWKIQKKQSGASKHICSICGDEFLAWPNKHKFYMCHKHKLYTKCLFCNKILYIKYPTNIFCSKRCSTKFRASNNIKPGLCKNCKKYAEKRNGTGLCLECNLKLSDKMLEKTLSKIGQIHPCSVCGIRKKIVDNAGMCYECSCDQGKNVWKNANSDTKLSMLENLKLHKPLKWENLSEESKKIMLSNLKSSVEFTDKELERLNSIDIEVAGVVNYENSKEFKDIIGVIGLTGVFKGDNKRYALTAGKSINLEKEIKKFWRIISNPEKQIPYNDIRDIKFKDYGRWYDITHDYFKFEIIIIKYNCNENEALQQEAAWAVQNNAVFQFDSNHKKLEGTHGYWMGNLKGD